MSICPATIQRIRNLVVFRGRLNFITDWTCFAPFDSITNYELDNYNEWCIQVTSDGHWHFRPDMHPDTYKDFKVIESYRIAELVIKNLLEDSDLQEKVGV